MSDADWGQIILLIILLAMVISLLVFSKRLHTLTYDLGVATKQNADQNERLEATVDRMEDATRVVAENLAGTLTGLDEAARQRLTQGATMDRMEAATVVVAENLASSVSRADATEGPEGAAADAALRTGDTAAAITKRQDDKRGGNGS